MRLADNANALGRPIPAPSSDAQAPGGAVGREIGGTRQPGVKEVASEFEALLLQQLVAAMREGTTAEGEGGPGSQLVDHFIEQGLAGHLASAGGIGLARYLERETGEDATDAARSAGVIGAAGPFGKLMRPGGVDALERLVRFAPEPTPTDSTPTPAATTLSAPAE
jgi:Rod binding domain-containing protein